MSGFFGGNKVRLSKLTEAHAIRDFWSRYQDELRNTVIDSIDGREYISIRIGEWF